MQPTEPTPPGRVPRAWQPRFDLRGLFLVTLVCAVMAAAGSYFVQSLRGGRQLQLSFILFTLASPALLVVVVSLSLWLLKRMNRRS